ncbi:MerR family transcriptional regulator [Winogradskyella litoriviva]|uniref:MerR family transcriptional regulator n=1 Tax=Winogradskyella litoriviva TaxID=1220182 RepID=A0ABX2E2E4_9FLAO|nr:MerR family transcriptional regulator [Winogradskyella litoriviva]NRD22404.1 MerR family transcriptional regulator [Winogradskyella litoriviva]
MNNIKNRFSIKDLENLTGIKAHTIRIWEKRYNLLEPQRTETNIRYYDLANFQKLLNISYLNENGYKISKIATTKADEIPKLVKEIATGNNVNSQAINDFKLSMLNFDQALFYKTYENLNKEKVFEDIFFDVFMPFLNDIGFLWQTDTISPAHEHFISALIRQKLLINIEKIQSQQTSTSNKTYVLYLPENEIHELGLMFINYKLISLGHHSIFLGPSIPIANLVDFQDNYEKVNYISYFSIKPERENLNTYLEEFDKIILKNSNSKLWVTGHIVNNMETETIPENIRTFKDLKTIIEAL